MWSAISTKIGRAVGAKDTISIGKYFKMAIYLAAGSGVLTWVLLYPFGPMLLKALYAPNKAVYDLAWPYMIYRWQGFGQSHFNQTECLANASLSSILKVSIILQTI